MRNMLAVAALLPLAALGACDAIQRSSSVKQCTDFFDYSRDEDVSDDILKTVCECAVDREAAGATPVASVPDRGKPELGPFRRHIPDCLEANGASSRGVAARESAGPAPRPGIFNPDTGTVTQPEGQVLPDPPQQYMAAPPDGDMEKMFNDAMQAAEEARARTENISGR